MAFKGLLSLLAEGMSPENLKRIGMLTDESAQNPTAVKTAQTKYQKLYEGNDQFRAREEQTMLNPQVVQRGLLDDRRIIMPEDIENTVLVPHKGDISGTDVTLTNIGGFELPVPVTSRGGARYPNSPRRCCRLLRNYHRHHCHYPPVQTRATSSRCTTLASTE